jgi:hypothetical protein
LQIFREISAPEHGAGFVARGLVRSTLTDCVAFRSMSGVPAGIRIDGKTALIGGRARHGHIDLHLVLPIIDQCANVGIDILDTSNEALIDVVDRYIAVAPGAKVALRSQDMRGLAAVTGGQLAGSVDLASGGRAVGLIASGSNGIQVSGLKILEHARPASLTGCGGFALRLAIANPSSRPGPSGMTLRDCESGTADILLSGQNSAFASGVRVEGSAKRLRIDATAISVNAVGDANKRVMLADRPLAVPSRVGDLVVLAVINAGVFAFAFLTGRITSAAQFGDMVYADPSWIVVPGRIAMSLFALVTIWLTWSLARRFFGEREGLVAALLMALNPVFITWSEIIRSDVMGCVFMLLCMHSCAAIAVSGKWRDYLMAALWLDVAVATKWPFALTEVAFSPPACLLRIQAHSRHAQRPSHDRARRRRCRHSVHRLARFAARLSYGDAQPARGGPAAPCRRERGHHPV